MIFQILAPGIEILAPIRDLKISREDEISYLREHGVEEAFEKYAYSINQGLWGTSVGGQETLTSEKGLPEGAYPDQLTESGEKDIIVSFRKGELEGGLEAIYKMQEEARGYAIGRGIHVGETIIGIRGRVGFEAAAPMIILKAHQELEKFTLGKWQSYWKDQLSEWYGMMLHEGQYLDPVMRNIEVFLEASQSHVTGDVYIKLRPYAFEVSGVKSDYDLMAASGTQYGEMNEGFTGEDVKGFTRIISNPSRIYHAVHQKKKH
jgi:argininosuccinate synthase